MPKRLFDLVFSLLGLAFLLPLLVIVAIWIKMDSLGPVFFRQERVGRHGKLFRIHKFRTMRVDSEADGKLTVGKDSRITSSGRFLRKYKVDELPQLLDVLVGTMSFVGPRPEVKEFIDCYPEDVRREVLSVKPGITDRASIEMVDENALLAQYPEPRQAYIDVILPLKQQYYLDYVRNNGIFGDLMIIFSTLKKVIVR